MATNGTNIETGLAIKIEGELGKEQTLPIDNLIKIAESLQDLVFAIADTNIINDRDFRTENFKIELSDFKKGSAIPVFVLTPRIDLRLHNDVQQQRKRVVEKVDELLNITNNGNFSDLSNIYPNPLRRNRIVSSLFNFTSSFNNSPVSFGKIDQTGAFRRSYKLKKLTTDLKDRLLTEVTTTLPEAREAYNEFSEILITIGSDGKKKKKTLASVAKDNHSLSYSPNFIIVNGRRYIFSITPISSIQREKDHYVITNELFDIHAAGATQMDAERDFNETFDYLYQRLVDADDKNLSERMVLIKSFVKHHVKEVIKW